MFPHLTRAGSDEGRVFVSCSSAGGQLGSLLTSPAGNRVFIVGRPYPTRASQPKIINIYTQPKAAAHFIVSMSEPWAVILLSEPDQLV